jgi:hypothetical protein
MAPKAAPATTASVHLSPTVQVLERRLLIRRSTVLKKKEKKAGQLVREVSRFMWPRDRWG